jgi:hypothetical protein
VAFERDTFSLKSEAMIPRYLLIGNSVGEQKDMDWSPKIP